jgi:predicted SnoaL-like aldol condensation-catalyzing enzyme
MKNIILLLFVTFLSSGCMRQNPQLYKETDANKKVVLSFFNTAFNERNPVKAVNEYTPDAISHSIKGDTLLKGRTDIAGAISTFIYDTDNLKFNHEWTYAEGDMVIVRWIVNCTPKINLPDMPAGKPVVIKGCTFFRLIDRKISWSYTYWNFI